MPSRRQIEERVDALREQHDGKEFAAAVEAYAAGLEEQERATLQQVLVERAAAQGAFERGIALRAGHRGWFRRQWDKLERTIPR